MGTPEGDEADKNIDNPTMVVQASRNKMGLEESF